MRPLKALISKNTIHRAHVSGKWSPASNFKLDDLKEGYLIHLENGFCYTYVRTSIASKIINSISTPCDYAFIRYDNNHDIGWNDIKSYKNFPYNKLLHQFNADYVYAKEVNFKNSDELKAYLTDEVPEILKKLKTV